MKKFKVLTLSVCVLLFFAIIIVNFFLLNSREKPNGEYRVEIERAVTSIENNKDLCIDDYKYIKNIAVSKLPDAAPEQFTDMIFQSFYFGFNKRFVLQV